jgi:hypothetical protein
MDEGMMTRSTLASWLSTALVAGVIVFQVAPLRAQGAKPAASAAPAASASAVTPAASASAAAPAATAPAASASAKPAATAAPTTPAAGASAPAATTAAPASTPKPATAATAAPGTVDGSTYAVRLRDLEQRVDELKEQIRRSHTRLSLLSDTILSGGVGGARAEISFKNDLTNAFHLTGATFVLDGAVQYNKQDESGTLAEQKQIPIFSGSIPPGDHTVQVVLKLRGHGYGVFSYLRGYKFNVPSTHSFTVTEGKSIKLEAVVWEKGDVTTPLEERPAIRWQHTVGSIGDDRQSAPAPSKAAASGSISVGAGTK